jgi:hypothetical protein
MFIKATFMGGDTWASFEFAEHCECKISMVENTHPAKGFYGKPTKT